jgi:hypothetical protein
MLLYRGVVALKEDVEFFSDDHDRLVQLELLVAGLSGKDFKEFRSVVVIVIAIA